jgi:hypothetical protein
MFPKKGKIFPNRRTDAHAQPDYAEAMADALRSELGDTHQAVKIAMRWTGANERTVKNWIAGTNGPSGAHLVGLAHHSDTVLDAFLRLSGRNRPVATEKLIAARDVLDELVCALGAAERNSPIDRTS